MTVRLYTSADAGAPALRGNSPGDLIALLTACLVTGYGSKPGAGWTREFVNGPQTIAAFKQGIGSNGMFLRVDDTQVVAAIAARAARVVAYENMSSLDVGSPAALPSEAAISGGLFWSTLPNQSAEFTNRDQARQWAVIADERAFYIWIKTSVSATGAGYRGFHFFGDINSLDPSDVTATVLWGDPTLAGINGSGGTHPADYAGNSVGSLSNGCYIARDYSGNTSVQVGHHGDYAKQGTSTWGVPNASTGVPYPNPVDNTLVMTPIWIHEPASRAIRGVMPGLWPPCSQLTSVEQLIEFDGQGMMDGKRFIVLQIGTVKPIVEITGDWDR